MPASIALVVAAATRVVAIAAGSAIVSSGGSVGQRATFELLR